MAAIKSDIAIYAIHTNLDNIISGVNATIADRLGLINREILLPRAEQAIRWFRTDRRLKRTGSGRAIIKGSKDRNSTSPSYATAR